MGQRIPVTLGNIAPLAVRPFDAGKLALVCEGGGQRGIFTAGVLDEFMRARFNPFDFYFGTSAGAQNLSAYVCNQLGYARRVITRYTTTKDFFDPMRFVRGGNLIDLDWLVEATSSKMPLAMDVAARHFDSGKAFFMCASRADDYTPGYFSPTKETWMDLIRASSAIPGFYRSGVTMDGISWLDGGVSDAIPVREAARHGAKTIVVIRTVPSQMFYTPQWFKRMERWLGESSLQPFVNLVQHHEKTYGEIQQFIEKPPGNIRILEIYPPKPLKSMALGSRLPALLDDYNVGRQCGRYFLATFGKMLAEIPPLRRFKPRLMTTVPQVTPSTETGSAQIIIPAAAVANDVHAAQSITPAAAAANEVQTAATMTSSTPLAHNELAGEPVTVSATVISNMPVAEVAATETGDGDGERAAKTVIPPAAVANDVQAAGNITLAADNAAAQQRVILPEPVANDSHHGESMETVRASGAQFDNEDLA